VSLAVAGGAVLAACGGGGGAPALSLGKSTTTSPAPTVTTPATSRSTTPPTAAAGSSGVGNSGVSSTTIPAAGSGGGSGAGPGSLPVGAATSFVFGSYNDSGTPVSLLPPNADDVDQAAVSAAPRLGPFTVDPNAGPSTWPDACTLTNAAQLKALFPAITGVSGTQGQKANIIGGSGGQTPNNTDCQFNLTTTFDSGNAGGPPSFVEINLQEIDPDSPTIWQQSQQQDDSPASQNTGQYALYSNLPGGVSCFYDGTELQCLKGDFDYWISGMKNTGGNFETVDQAVWIDQIELPLAEVLATELQP
jgi:hypothetical protein